MPKIGNDPTDPRRLAFLMLIPGVAWAMHYWFPEQGAAFWIIVGCLLALVLMLVPIGPWQGDPRRRWVVVAIYGAASLLIALAGAFVHSRSA